MLLCYVDTVAECCDKAIIIGDTSDSDKYLEHNAKVIIENLDTVQKTGIRLAIYCHNYELEDVDELLSSSNQEILIRD